MSTDPRVGAWVKLHTPRRVYPTAEHGEVLTKRAEATLRVLDAADREQGTHRVRVDDATVERVMDALVMTRMGDYNIEIWEFRNAARAVLAALTGGES